MMFPHLAPPAPEKAPILKKPSSVNRSVFRFQFSLKTLLICMLLFGVLGAPITTAVTVARRREAAVRRLGHNGYELRVDATSTPCDRGVTGFFFSQQQWEFWFPMSAYRRIEKCERTTSDSTMSTPKRMTTPTSSPAEVFQTLNFFDGCRHVHVHSGSVSLRDLEQFRMWRSIESIRFESTSVSQGLLETLAKSPNLREVTFDGVKKLDRAELAALVSHLRLKRLRFQNGTTLDGEFAELPGDIEKLTMERGTFNYNDFRTLMAKSNVKSLEIVDADPNQPYTYGDAWHFGELTAWSSNTLEFLRIVDPTDKDLERISKAPKLESIELSGFGNLTQLGIAELARLPKLKNLTFEPNNESRLLECDCILCMPHTPYPGFPMDVVSSLVPLETLTLKRTSLSKEQSRALANHPTLRTLKLPDGGQKGKALWPLLESPQLKEIYCVWEPKDNSAGTFIAAATAKGIKFYP